MVPSQFNSRLEKSLVYGIGDTGDSLWLAIAQFEILNLPINDITI